MNSGGLGSVNTEPLFRVSGLRVDYDAAGGERVQALRGVSLDVLPGQALGVLGESGSGKSSLALALMRLLPSNARVSGGAIEYCGRDLWELSATQLRDIRGGAVSLISQEPALALNPVLTVGTQLTDVLKAHAKLDRAPLAARCREMLHEVGFDAPERIMRAYPHQLSGGQRQRVAIAQALVCRPQLLIADEPLSSLDAGTQAEVLELLQRLREERTLAVLMITHNAGVLASLAGQIIVMRQGEIAARGSMRELERSRDAYVQSILFPEREIAAQPARTGETSFALEVRRLSKTFVQRRILSRQKFEVRALDEIDLDLRQGATLAVLGRSGSGKSTLARCIAGFERADSGEVRVHGTKPETRSVQMIFQDAATSLNPRFTACRIVAEPLEIARWKTGADRIRRALDLMEEVGLDPAWAERTPSEFSGGQRQRLAVARALAAEPALLVLDEAFSGLDLPLQARMVHLLMELQARHGLAYLYISHDLNFVARFAHDVVVMDAGKIVERLPASGLAQAQHPVTRALVAAGERLRARGVEVTA